MEHVDNRLKFFIKFSNKTSQINGYLIWMESRRNTGTMTKRYCVIRVCQDNRNMR